MSNLRRHQRKCLKTTNTLTLFTKTQSVLFLVHTTLKLLRVLDSIQRDLNPFELLLETHRASVIVIGALTALAFALRFYKINYPDQVV